jgi:hypothetical protein
MTQPVPQPTDWQAVWNSVRTALEVLYFVSGFGLFVAACYGFKQVKAAVAQLDVAARQLELTKELSDSNK